MCGIFGVQPTVVMSTSVLCAMSRILRHRGPDDEGFLTSPDKDTVRHWFDVDTPAKVRNTFRDGALLPPDQMLPAARWALGHRRLSILDLSAAGHQPMSYRGRYWIVYNGEVYNYLELRQELAVLGHEFVSGSDTEVILAAYDQWGADCLRRFNGMWALAILDQKERTLFLARDRFGVKPLYMRWSPAGLAFASEIKAFTALPDWNPTANLPRVLDYLVWELSDHTQETMFAGVEQLLPGHHLTLPCDRISDASQRPAPVRWYEITPRAGVRDADAADLLRDTLTQSVRLRLRADVPVGSCLSGGLDSSAIVALMSQQLKASQSQQRQVTITARSHDPRFDESHHARAVIAATEVEGVFITPDPQKLFNDLDRLIWHQDEPFVSTSIFAQWCVFQSAREQGLTVMLDGQGADESLGGYRGFFGAHLAGLLRKGRLFAWVRDVLAMRRTVGFSLLRSVGYTLAYAFPAIRRLLGRFDHRAFGDHSWLMPAVRDAAKHDPSAALGGRASSVRGMSLAMLSATNLPMLLRWEDRNSMAASIEARVPFLDYRVVELCLGMNDEVKVGGGIAKRVLRHAMRGLVPEQILERKDKMGFVTAERTWMITDCPEQFRQALVDATESLAPIVDSAVVAHFDEVVQGKRPFDHRYWRIIALGRWCKRFKVAMS